MGVMSCDRDGCDNIMCDKYAPDYGYICDDCFKELCTGKFGLDVEMFMHRKKQKAVEINYTEIFSKVFE